MLDTILVPPYRIGRITETSVIFESGGVLFGNSSIGTYSIAAPSLANLT